jgi:hypothetical protein
MVQLLCASASYLRVLILTRVVLHRRDGSTRAADDALRKGGLAREVAIKLRQQLRCSSVASRPTSKLLVIWVSHASVKNGAECSAPFALQTAVLIAMKGMLFQGQDSSDLYIRRNSETQRC